MDVSRRGSAAVAALLVMVLFGLTVVLMVMGGASDQDLTLRRLETVRAFYAAEAGVNMAMRELTLDVDEDGDGGIGTIADDGDPSTDPSLSGARFFVGAEFGPGVGQVTLTSRGRSGSSNRVADVLLTMEDYEPVAMIAYGKDGEQRPAFRQWDHDAGMWGAEALANSVGDVPYWIVLRGDPRSERFALGVLGNDQRITVQTWDPESQEWSTPFIAASDAGEQDTRVFDLAFEPLSGGLILVYRRAGSNNVCYRTWDDDTWSAESTINLLPHQARWLRLVPRPHSNEMLLFASSTHNQAHTRLISWNGSSFVNQTQLGTPGVEYEHFDVAFESLSGRGMALYSRGSSVPGFRRLVDGAWSGEQLAPAVPDDVLWTRLASNPIANEIVMAVKDDDDGVSMNVWNGASWAAPLTVDFPAKNEKSRSFDVAYGRNTGSALLVYGHEAAAPRARLWNGSSWSAEFDGPAGGDDPFWIVQAVRGVVQGQVFVTWLTDDPVIRTAIWDGASFSAPLDLSMPGMSREYESFMAATANDGKIPRVFAWTEIEP